MHANKQWRRLKIWINMALEFATVLCRDLLTMCNAWQCWIINEFQRLFLAVKGFCRALTNLCLIPPICPCTPLDKVTDHWHRTPSQIDAFWWKVVRWLNLTNRRLRHPIWTPKASYLLTYCPCTPLNKVMDHWHRPRSWIDAFWWKDICWLKLEERDA